MIHQQQGVVHEKMNGLYKCVTGKDNPRKLYGKYATIIFNTDRDEAIDSIDIIIADLQGLKRNFKSEETNDGRD